MARLSKTLVTLAGRVVFERHRDEAKTEAYQLRRTLERLLTRGATVATPRPPSCITLLVRGERSKRVMDTARAACAAAGNDRMGVIFDDMRKGK